MDAIQVLQALSKAADQIGSYVREEVAQSMVLWRDLVAVDVISVTELKRPDQAGEVAPC